MVWGDWFWEVPGENQSKQGKVCYADLGCSLPIDKSFYRLSLLLFLVQRGGSLTNGDFPYKCKLYLLGAKEACLEWGIRPSFLGSFFLMISPHQPPEEVEIHQGLHLLPQTVGHDLAIEQQCQAESEFLEIQLPRASQAVLLLEGGAVLNYSSYRGGKINFLLLL